MAPPGKERRTHAGAIGDVAILDVGVVHTEAFLGAAGKVLCSNSPRRFAAAELRQNLTRHLRLLTTKHIQQVA